MPSDRVARGGKRYGAGRKLLSPGSFLKSTENRENWRKKWKQQHSRLFIKKSIHNTWKKLKGSCLYSSDTAFAQHLLSLEMRRRARINLKTSSGKSKDVHDHDQLRDETSSNNCSVSTSTPVKKRVYSAPEQLEESPILIKETSFDADVNVTGSTFHMSESSSEDSSADESRSSSNDDCDSDDEVDFNASAMSDALKELDEDRDKDTSSSEDEEDVLFMEEVDAENTCMMPDENFEFELSGYMEDPVEYDSDVTEKPHEEVTAIEPRQEDPAPGLKHIPIIKETGKEPKKFSRWEESTLYQSELTLVQATKVICALDLLVQVFSEKCRAPGCHLPTLVNYTLCGTSALIKWKCKGGHCGKFCTSHKAEGDSLLANNLQTSAAVLLSGNNFDKIAKFADFLGLSFISSATFYRAQKIYLIPAVTEWWKWQQGEIFKELKNKDLVVCGDGQCDSPGFTAKNLCYYLMEMTTSYIIDVEVMDKREVELRSVNMEKAALLKILGRLKNILNIVELVTDASASIKKAIATMFKDVFHSLDIWHKAKSIKKCISKVGATKGMEKINKWSEHIIRHFWHCSRTVSQIQPHDDELALSRMKELWISLLHHVCNQHEWLGGKCSHGEIPADDRELPWFDRRDKDFEALQAIILEPTLLESFDHYTRFRHTGGLERANSLSLMYASKRNPFTKKGLTARKQLASIDWNYHLDTKAAVNTYGEASVSRKYNQRTKAWNVKVLKESKDYHYIWMLMARVFRLRSEDEGGVARNVSMDADDPRRIAPTIAEATPVPSIELYERHATRFPKVL